MVDKSTEERAASANLFPPLALPMCACCTHKLTFLTSHPLFFLLTRLPPLLQPPGTEAAPKHSSLQALETIQKAPLCQSVPWFHPGRANTMTTACKAQES